MAMDAHSGHSYENSLKKVIYIYIYKYIYIYIYYIFLYRSYIFDIDLRQSSCLISTVIDF